MAAPLWFPVAQWRTANLFAIPGRFTTAATAAPTAVTGAGFSVAYAATGIFNVTFDTNHNTLIAIPWGFMTPATSEFRATLTAFSAGSDGVNATAQFSISLLAASAYTADATNTGDTVHFCALFRNTGFDYNL